MLWCQNPTRFWRVESIGSALKDVLSELLPQTANRLWLSRWSPTSSSPQCDNDLVMRSICAVRGTCLGLIQPSPEDSAGTNGTERVPRIGAFRLPRGAGCPPQSTPEDYAQDPPSSCRHEWTSAPGPCPR